MGLDAGEIVETLQQNLPKQTSRFGRRHGPLTRFTLSSIELFNTWQGTIAYSLLVAGVLYGLNLQHRQLQLAQRQSLQPIAANPVKASEVGQRPEISASKSCCACIRFAAPAANPTITAGTARHKRRCQLNSSARSRNAAAHLAGRSDTRRCWRAVERPAPQSRSSQAQHLFRAALGRPEPRS